MGMIEPNRREVLKRTFEQVAAAYDDARPDYPAALMGDSIW